MTFDDISSNCRITRGDVRKKIKLDAVTEWIEANGAEAVVSRGRGKVGKIILGQS